MRKEEIKWIKETPTDVYRWLCIHDGQEAVAVDDETMTYFCSAPVMMDNYRDAWAKEGKRDDPRKAKMFYDLARTL